MFAVGFLMINLISCALTLSVFRISCKGAIHVYIYFKKMAVLHVLVCYQYYKGQVTRQIAQMLDSQEPIFFIYLFSTWIAATVYTSKIHNSINCFTDDLLGKGSVMKDWGVGFFTVENDQISSILTLWLMLYLNLWNLKSNTRFRSTHICRGKNQSTTFKTDHNNWSYYQFKVLLGGETNCPAILGYCNHSLIERWRMCKME